LRATYLLLIHPLHNHPGPWHWAISDLPRLLHILRGTDVHHAHHLHQNHGPIVRLPPQRHLLLRPLPQRRHAHRGRQRALIRGFSDRALRDQDPLIQKHINKMILTIHQNLSTTHLHNHKQSSTINLLDILIFTAFHLQAELTFGESLHLLDSHAYLPWVRAAFAGLKFMAISGALAQLPFLGPVIQFLIYKTLRRTSREHFQFSVDMVNRRLDRQDTHTCTATRYPTPDIWHFVLQQQERDGGARLSVPEMDANAFAIMLAGGETVASVLSGLFYHLLDGEGDAYDRLVGEIRGRFKREEGVTTVRVAGLRYLNACLNESMRLYP
ncbi:cytochrome P450, partial [Aspergillus ellipticus CBS 707.79]